MVENTCVSSNYLLSLWLQQQILAIGMKFIRIKELRGMEKLTACIRMGAEQFKEWWSRGDELWSSWGVAVWSGSWCCEGMYVDLNVPSYDAAIQFTILTLDLSHNPCNSEGATDDLCKYMCNWNSAHYYIFANDPGDHVVL